jgi:hypothetical protein
MARGCVCVHSCKRAATHILVSSVHPKGLGSTTSTAPGAAIGNQSHSKGQWFRAEQENEETKSSSRDVGVQGTHGAQGMTGTGKVTCTSVPRPSSSKPRTSEPRNEQWYDDAWKDISTNSDMHCAFCVWDANTYWGQKGQGVPVPCLLFSDSSSISLSQSLPALPPSFLPFSRASLLQVKPVHKLLSAETHMAGSWGLLLLQPVRSEPEAVTHT